MTSSGSTSSQFKASRAGPMESSSHDATSASARAASGHESANRHRWLRPGPRLSHEAQQAKDRCEIVSRGRPLRHSHRLDDAAGDDDG